MAHVNPEKLQKLLSGIDYPSSKDQIVSHAKSQAAESTILSLLNKLPRGNYRAHTDISRAIGDLE